jgi:hypothetical protein
MSMVFLRSVRRLLVPACVVPSSPIFVTLMKEAPGSSETSALTRATWRNIPEDTTLHSHRCENLKSYIKLLFICPFLVLRHESCMAIIFLFLSHIHGNAATFWVIAPCSPYVNWHSSKTSLNMWTTWWYIPEDGNINNYRCVNLKPYAVEDTSHLQYPPVSLYTTEANYSLVVWSSCPVIKVSSF